tara:strand:+ start:102 stop:749 length:648 start_codon:yes stop_codon:yes gene_type:complete
MIDKKSFNSAKKNMAYDETLIKQLHSRKIKHFYRFYQWKNRGLTQAKNKTIPPEFLTIDNAYRITGGGLVFHCPEDIVFSIGNAIHHTILPKSIKKRCEWISKFLCECLIQLNLPVKSIGNILFNNQDINFCSSYHNPYEITLETNKVIAISVKKTKDWIVFQGVIHMSSTHEYFNDYSCTYKPYFTTGINQNFSVNSVDIINVIFTQLKLQKLL